ncbi:bifunctional 2-polyprenyl-6-hydroxyphenol methylase/3-demethylubiquinol 3-O-methyltransferase UbiG [Allomuricauda sp. SCSIO 65647]|uniref:class I SAM-dependent methyltransferase n=1 Tax=Allomuricauda sp. SCSIO 65647 TaxID=2908843 RepID=UPI001F2BC35F|nr:class I SAM-dependent methyltransferase [Muricauda sp. SCSIO 65647]UJH66633.1 class I SAM-dependent methyltransferase [Muricauda sp. SCSIO 65647]
MDDILGRALLDFQKGAYTEDIKTFSSLDEEDVMPLPYLFRNYSEMPKLEQKALHLCQGKILDIGCGAGSHSLYLQGQGHEVTCIDSSKGAVDTCGLRGLTKVIYGDILTYSGTTFDTLLLLMNGIGIVGRLEKLTFYLDHFKKLLKPGGQILMDSSDIIYMYDQDEDGGRWIPGELNYYGEVQFTLEYKGKRSDPFDWLYIDYNTLRNIAETNDFSCELVSQGEHYDYLARLTIKP